jgi:dipeptidyl aminopeptidase/acylaminoacyl peptidase
MNKKTLIYLFPILVVLGLFFVRKNFGQPKNNLTKTINPKVNQVDKNTPTPFPFQELTIPSLQNRNYQSQLNELNQLSQNANYTSYLTSYQSDGLKINGLLTRPSGQQPEDGWPAVVFIHGYIPPQNYQTTERYNDYVDYLARNGLVVFKIDLRGHGNSQGDPSSAYYSSDYIIDTLNAYSALQKTNFINPQKIGLWGHSMGGNIVLRSMTTIPEIKSGVIWSGTVFTYDDFVEYGIDDDSYQPPSEDSPRRQRRQELFDTYGRYDPNSEFWSQVTPKNYLESINGAIQLHHATNDQVTSIEYSRNINRLLNENNINSQLYEYSQGGHNLVSPAFSAAMQRTVEFYNQNF